MVLCLTEICIFFGSHYSHSLFVCLFLLTEICIFFGSHYSHSLFVCLFLPLPPGNAPGTHFCCGTAAAQWLRCCATNGKVAGSIPAGVSEFFIDIKSFRSHYGPGVDQEHFLGVKAAGA